MAWGDISNHEYDAARVNESTLIRRVREGDIGAFKVLMTQYLDDVTRFAFYLVHSRDLADDIAQQVFIGLWEHRTTIDPTRSLKPYLFRSTHNRAIDERRAESIRERYRVGIQGEIEAGVVQGSIPSPEDSIVTIETLRVLFKELPERRRLVLRLRIIDGLTHSEIAEVLGLSHAAARQLVSRAMAEFRKILQARHTS